MIISNVSMEDLLKAMRETNKVFKRNVRFRDIERLGKKDATPQDKRRYQLTLKVESSKGLGSRLGFSRTSLGNRRHLPCACWHVHGVFFDSLPVGAKIRTGRVKTAPCEAWQDFNVGSMVDPAMFSDLCECYENGVKLPSYRVAYDYDRKRNIHPLM